MEKYTDPTQVQKLANKYDVGKVFPSTRKDKKYMIQDPKGKWIHFGQYPYEDYTKHKDPVRRRNFLVRNSKWRNAPIYTPAWLSYHLLW
jgi:hypothetical protein